MARVTKILARPHLTLIRTGSNPPPAPTEEETREYSFWMGRIAGSSPFGSVLPQLRDLQEMPTEYWTDQMRAEYRELENVVRDLAPGPRRIAR